MVQYRVTRPMGMAISSFRKLEKSTGYCNVRSASVSVELWSLYFLVVSYRLCAENMC